MTRISYTLQRMFVCLSLMCIAFAFATGPMRQRQQQIRSVERLRRSGCYVLRSNFLGLGIVFPGGRPAYGFEHPSRVNIDEFPATGNESVSDEDIIKLLRSIRGLTYVDFGDRKVNVKLLDLLCVENKNCTIVHSQEYASPIHVRNKPIDPVLLNSVHSLKHPDKNSLTVDELRKSGRVMRADVDKTF
ncbi:MAG: hypothetical protein R3C28_19275 [Pirellulaceae bacterium]